MKVLTMPYKSTYIDQRSLLRVSLPIIALLSRIKDVLLQKKSNLVKIWN